MKNNGSKACLPLAGLLGIFLLGPCLLGTVLLAGFLLPGWLADTFPLPGPRAEVNLQDPFIREREKQFHLSRVLPRYDAVIEAIERYRQERGSYPPDLKALAPVYLLGEPGIYILNGERIRYELHPEEYQYYAGPVDRPEYIFSVYGHYPFPAGMHGWYLMYCPAAYADCAPGGDRHVRIFRVNDRWVWINSSAL